MKVEQQDKRHRISGAPIIEDIPWGTHFAHFYESEEDLIDVLVSYFKVGLLGNEFCMWVTVGPLTTDKAKEALQQALPDVEEYISRGQLEIVSYEELYLRDGYFDEKRVLDGWISKLDSALSMGFEGLRVTGNTFFLERSNRDSFMHYENTVNEVLGQYKVVAICSYYLPECTLEDILDAASAHEFTLIRRGGVWRVIESSEKIKAERERNRAEEELRQALHGATTQVISEESLEDTFEALLEALLRLTESEFGFIAEVLYTPEGKPYGKCHAISDIAWDQASRELIKSAPEGLEFHNLETLFGRVMTEKVVVISNDPASDPRAGGLPPGHPPLRSFMGIPFLHGGEIIGMAGVANCPGGYDAEAAEFLGPFCSACGVIISALRKDLERKRAEEETRSLKEFNENVIQSIQDGLVAIDRDFRIILWNKAMEEISGRAAEEVLGKIASDVLPHLIEQGADELFQDALRGRVSARSNIPYKRPKGKVKYANEKYLPLRDQAGEVVGALAIVEDVTEMRRMEVRVVRLQEVIRQRKLIEVAKGILMREMGLSEAESYKLIQKKSRDENMKMKAVAEKMIEFFGSREEREKFI